MAVKNKTEIKVITEKARVQQSIVEKYGEEYVKAEIDRLCSVCQKEVRVSDIANPVAPCCEHTLIPVDSQKNPCLYFVRRFGV